MRMTGKFEMRLSGNVEMRIGGNINANTQLARLNRFLMKIQIGYTK